MSDVVVNIHRFSVAPELIPGSRWQPYDPEVDRPATVTEGAHLAQYYSNAWLAACKAGEQLQLQAEQEMQRLEQEAQRLEQETLLLEQRAAQFERERDLANNAVHGVEKRNFELEDKLANKYDMAVWGWSAVGFLVFGFIGYAVGVYLAAPAG